MKNWYKITAGDDLEYLEAGPEDWVGDFDSVEAYLQDFFYLAPTDSIIVTRVSRPDDEYLREDIEKGKQALLELRRHIHKSQQELTIPYIEYDSLT